MKLKSSTPIVLAGCLTSVALLSWGLHNRAAAQEITPVIPNTGPTAVVTVNVEPTSDDVPLPDDTHPPSVTSTLPQPILLTPTGGGGTTATPQPVGVSATPQPAVSATPQPDFTDDTDGSVEEPLIPPTFTATPFGAPTATFSASLGGGPRLTPGEVFITPLATLPIGGSSVPGSTLVSAATLRPYPTRTATNALTPSATPLPTLLPETGDVWTEPLNLSRAGASSLPSMAADGKGNLYALWWDEFAFAQYAFNNGKNWTGGVTIPNVLGEVDKMQNNKQLPPREMTILASQSGWVHVFWIDADANLMHTRTQSGSTNWSKPVRIATAPAAWQARLDSAGRIHVAFIRNQDTEGYPQGVYYRTSRTDGKDWPNSVFVHTSPYFRVIAAGQGHVNLAVVDQTILLGWDDPQFNQSFTARSIDGGKTFEPLNRVDSLQDRPAREVRFIPLPTPQGEFLRIWAAGDSCTFYQQQSSEQGAVWSSPVRVFETLDGCLAQDDYFTLTDDQLLYVNTFGRDAGTRSTLLAWNGSNWSEPFSILVEFQNRVTSRPAALACTRPVLSGEHVFVVGCDQDGDILVTRSVDSAIDMLPILQRAWSPLVELASNDENVGVPVAVAEQDGTIHALWGEATSLQDPSYRGLTYVRGDGKTWSSLATAIDIDDRLDMPNLAVGADGVLHAVWSRSGTGLVMYSRTFGRDAVSENSWTKPIELPVPAQVSGFPSITLAPDGGLHVVYTVPVNEQRGVYHLVSLDQGLTWSEPHLVFDAAAENWLMVRNPSVKVDNANRVHVVWAQSTLPGDDQPLGIYYTFSDDGGQHWINPNQLDGLGAGFPQMVLSAESEVQVAWARQAADGLDLWVVRSTDSGQGWQQAVNVPNFKNITPSFGMVTAGQGSLYLVALRRSEEKTADLMYTRWDGSDWVDANTISLGVDASDNMGTTVVLAPNQLLGVFYRVQAISFSGQTQNRIGYLQRNINTEMLATPVPAERITLTPPLATVTNLSAAATTPDLQNTLVQPTATALVANPTDLNNAPDRSGVLWRVLAVLGIMGALSLGIVLVWQRQAASDK